MDVLILTVFISLMLAAGAVLFLAKRVRDGDFEHGDRLSLLPLQDDDGTDAPGGSGSPDPSSDRSDIEDSHSKTETTR